MALGHRILGPLDGSELAERVLPIAAAIAKHAEGTLHLARVHGPWLPMMDTPPSAAGIVAEAEAEARDASELYIEKRLESLRDAGVSATATMRLGAPDEEILRAAAEEGCDLIAMVTHGRGG
ncbi:MAG TPA: universal stress protein, partial [Longimicrobiales bacterium]|nr:universal stress protein [Longimicrobiales bacterium]